MAGALKSTSEGRTLILTLSNPEHRNALGPEIYAAGVEALNAAENNPEIRSVVITGEGSTFCAGADLLRLQANRQKPAEVQAQSIEALHSWVDSIRTFPKPVIAAVEGAAAGAGFSLALACCDCRPTGKNRQKFRRKVSRPCTAGLTLSGPFPNR